MSLNQKAYELILPPASKSQPQPAVIQITNSTLPQKHLNRPLNPLTSKWPTQPSDRSDWYVLTERFLQSNPLTSADGQVPENPRNTALLTALCIFSWHQYYRLNMARVVLLHNHTSGTRIHFAKKNIDTIFLAQGNMSALFYGYGNMSKNWNLSKSWKFHACIPEFFCVFLHKVRAASE